MESDEDDFVKKPNDKQIKRDKQSFSRETNGTRERIIESITDSNQIMMRQKANNIQFEIDMGIGNDSQSATIRSKSDGSEMSYDRAAFFDYSKPHDESLRDSNPDQNAYSSKPSESDQWNYNLASTSEFSGRKSNIPVSSQTFTNNNFAETNLVLTKI